MIANQYDNDGVDIYFLGGEKFGLQLKARHSDHRSRVGGLRGIDCGPYRRRMGWKSTSKTCEWTP